MWVYKYVCVKAGVCGNCSYLVRDSLRNAADPGPTFKEEQCETFLWKKISTYSLHE